MYLKVLSPVFGTCQSAKYLVHDQWMLSIGPLLGIQEKKKE